MSKDVASAIRATLESPNEQDRNFEAANVVDALFAIARSNRRIANTILPADASPGNCPSGNGGKVDSLTEAIMGATAGLCQIAAAIRELADAVRGGEQ